MKYLCVLLLFFQSSLSFAKNIRLHDGSTVMGEIISMQNGYYTIKTQSLGIITLAEQKIVSISSSDSTSSSKQQNTAAQVMALQSSMANNKAVMQSIQHLQNNPAMQSILQDELIMKAIQSGDYNSLMSNKKILELMNQSEVKSIIREFK